MTPRASRIVLIASLAALALLTWGRIALVDSLHDHGFFGKYLEFADRILAGNPPRERIADVSPGYLWLMVLFRALGMGVPAIRNAQIIALSVAALFAAMAARRLGGWVAALATAALILGSRAALVTATELEPETLIFLLNAAALATITSNLAPRTSHLATGALLGLSAITRPTALAALVLLALWIGLSKRRAALQLLGAALVPIVVILLVNRALTGHTIIMHPGTVFYEGNNPLATGCAGVMPRVVADMNLSADEPDYLHVAYRLVASRATGQPPDARLSNRFWSRKAFAFMTTYPLRALELLAWKSVLAVHHYDVYDLVTMKRKDGELARWPAIPFGVSFVLAIAAFVLHRNRRDLVPPLLFAVATMLVLVAFYVTARQRNAMLAPLAILGGAGAAEIVRLARQRSERSLLAFGGVVILTPILGIEGAPMREDAYNWWAALNGDRLRAAAIEARDRGDRPRAATLAAQASILRIEETPLVAPKTLIPAAMDLAKRTAAPQQLFDIAIALQKAGAWREAEGVLAAIDDYRPRREHRAVSSVAYYRARGAVRLGAPRTMVLPLLERAEEDAPGDPDVLALRAILGDADAPERLDSMHDPFTRDVALAQAYADVGDRDRARDLTDGVRRRLPEWRRR